MEDGSFPCQGLGAWRLGRRELRGLRIMREGDGFPLLGLGAWELGAKGTSGSVGSWKVGNLGVGCKGGIWPLASGGAGVYCLSSKLVSNHRIDCLFLEKVFWLTRVNERLPDERIYPHQK